MTRKTERKGNTIKCPEERCVPLTNLWSCVHVCCSARSSIGVALWIKQAKNGGICNVSVCCLGGGGEILMENSRRGVRNALWNLTSFQAKMCVFRNPISDLTEVLREEWYKTYPMQVRPKELKCLWIADTERPHAAMRSAGKLLQTVPKLILQLRLAGWVIDLRVKDTEKAVQYSQSSPRDHPRKRPAQVTTTFVKPRWNFDLNLVMKISRKRPRPLLGLPNWTFSLFLSSRKRTLLVV